MGRIRLALNTNPAGLTGRIHNTMAGLPSFNKLLKNPFLVIARSVFATKQSLGVRVY
jgi:hypothetical protein